MHIWKCKQFKIQILELFITMQRALKGAFTHLIDSSVSRDTGNEFRLGDAVLLTIEISVCFDCQNNTFCAALFAVRKSFEIN